MSASSPGKKRVILLLAIVTLANGDSFTNSDNYELKHSEEISRDVKTIVLEFGNVNQPKNCSEFLNSLEVRSIYLRN